MYLPFLFITLLGLKPVTPKGGAFSSPNIYQTKKGSQSAFQQQNLQNRFIITKVKVLQLESLYMTRMKNSIIRVWSTTLVKYDFRYENSSW